jgi:hypothetical protein
MTTVYQEERFRQMLKARNVDVDAYVRSVERWMEYLEGEGIVPGGGDIQTVRDYLDAGISAGAVAADDVAAMALYSKLIEDYPTYTYLLTLANMDGVFAAIFEQLGRLEGEEAMRRVMEAAPPPIIGGRPEDNPAAVRRLIAAIELEVPPERRADVLTGNFHCIPLDAFRAKKVRFEAAPDLEAYLREERRLLLLELERCQREGVPWFESIVTDELIEMIRADETMGVGVRQGDRVIHTKVPFDAYSYAKEEDPAMRRYHACHCPMVRTSIRDGDPAPASFCHCSAGFERLPFEAIWGERVQVEIIETALSGAQRCRFAITIPEGRR